MLKAMVRMKIIVIVDKKKNMLKMKIIFIKMFKKMKNIKLMKKKMVMELKKKMMMEMKIMMMEMKMK